MEGMKAMVFAAGLGTRLGKITQGIPKALVRINGRSVLELAVEMVTSGGFDDIIVNVHHFADRVIEEVKELEKKGYRITVSDEREELLETGGGLYKARWFFDRNPFLVYNTDIITDLNIRSLYACHLKNKGLATLAVMNRSDTRFFLVDNKGLLKGWTNKSTGEKILCDNSGAILTEAAFCGIHVIEPSVFDYMSEGHYSLTTLYVRLAETQKIFTMPQGEIYWADIGNREDLEEVRRHFKNRN